MDIEYLMRYRPDSTGVKYRAIPMTPEQISERRMHMRRKLQGSSFQNKTNDQLDLSIYYELDGRAFYEDEKGYCFALKARAVRSEDAVFRKANAVIPFEYLNVKIQDFNWNVYGKNMTGTRDLLNKYFSKFDKMQQAGKGLYICSNTKGSGKTMLSCCILNELANRYACNIKFVNILDLLEMTKKGFNGQQDELERIRDATILCLDDIGVQMEKQWVDTVLYRLINERYSMHRITIYTSNVMPEKLKIDDRIIDRIEATSYVITLPEVSVRRMKSKAEMNALLNDIENPAESGNFPQDKPDKSSNAQSN